MKNYLKKLKLKSKVTIMMMVNGMMQVLVVQKFNGL